ncbi:glycosyltransferase family 4 protein, partial [Candidatus Pelagibacter sp.]|nr:glycosyltransferase family 4 protein [Candidatus Pelagibacter sp.]
LGFLQKLKKINVKSYFFVYDLLPVNYPQWFFKRVEKFTRIWLKEISQFNGVICISKNTRDDYLRFLNKNSIDVAYDFCTDVIPMGHDINDKQDKIFSEKDILTKDNQFIDFLIVGTIEPRKAHLEMLKTFELLWMNDRKIRLTVVGKKGWLSDSVINKFVNNGHFKDYFFYYSNITDSELTDIYKKTDVLIIPSYNEGFGLPIIEAKEYNKHILARNIPVFREILGEDGNFFPDTNTHEISSYMKKWIKNLRNGKIKKNNIESSTWEESTNQLVEILDKNVSF